MPPFKSTCVPKKNGAVVADTAVESDSDAVSDSGDGGMPADPGPRDVVDIHVTRDIWCRPPTFLKGAYRSAMRLALSEAVAGHRVGDEARISRAWKLFLLLSYCVDPREGGRSPRESCWSGSHSLPEATEFSC